MASDAWMSRLSADSGYLTGMFGPLVLLGLALGLVFMPLNSVILTDVPPQDAGAASGALQVVQQVGLAFGLSVLVVVFDIAGRYAPGHQLLAGVDAVFGAAIGFGALALVVLYTVRHR